MKKIVIVVASGGLLLCGCGTEYRVQSVINYDKPYASKWAENPPLHSLRRLTDPGAVEFYINPHTYNPLAINQSGDYNERNISLPVPRYFLTYPTEFKPVTLPKGQPSYYDLAAGIVDPRYRFSPEQYRNLLQNALLDVMQLSTATHLSELKATENNGNLLLGATTLGLAGGASLAAGATGKALAAAAAGTAGARSLFNEQIYRQTFVEATSALITKDQEDFESAIKQKQTNNISQYDVEAAIADARAYEERGSFYHGLELLQTAVQNKINGVTNIVTINQLVTTEISSPPSLTLQISTNLNNGLMTNDFEIDGQGLTLLNFNSIQNSQTPNKVAAVTLAWPSSDLKAHLTLKNIVTSNATDILWLPLQNGKAPLSIPVSVRVTNK